MFQIPLQRSPAEIVKEFISDIQLYRELVTVRVCVYSKVGELNQCKIRIPKKFLGSSKSLHCDNNVRPDRVCTYSLTLCF